MNRWAELLWNVAFFILAVSCLAGAVLLAVMPS